MCHLAAVLLTLAAGCSNKRALDQAAGQVLAAIATNDYASFREVAHPDLRRHIPAKGLRVLSRAFHVLGGLEDRTMTRIEVSTGGTSQGHYVLSFPKGEAGMVLTLREPEVVNLEFGGEPLRKALEAVRAQGYGKLGVLSFEWLNAKQLRSSKPLRFRMKVGGLGYDDKGTALVLSVLVMDSLGRIVLDRPRLAEKRGRVEGNSPPVATVEGAVSVPGGGKYRFDFSIHDIKAGLTHEHSESVVVQGPPASRPASRPTPDAGAPPDH